MDRLFMNISLTQMYLKDDNWTTYFNSGVYFNFWLVSPDKCWIQICCIVYVLKQFSEKYKAVQLRREDIAQAESSINRNNNNKAVQAGHTDETMKIEIDSRVEKLCLPVHF